MAPTLQLVILSVLFLLPVIQCKFLKEHLHDPRFYNENFFDQTIPHDRVNDTTIGDGLTVIYLTNQPYAQDTKYLFSKTPIAGDVILQIVSAFSLHNDESKDCLPEMYFCYFSMGTPYPSERCGKDFTEVRLKYRDRQFSISGCNETRPFRGNTTEANLIVDFIKHPTKIAHQSVKQPVVNCPFIDVVPYPYHSLYTQTMVRFFNDPVCDIFSMTYRTTLPDTQTGKLVKGPPPTTTTTTTTTTTPAPPVPLKPLPKEIYIAVGCICSTFIVATIGICTFTGILRSRRLKKQEALFYSVLRLHYQEQRMLNAESVLKSGKGAPMLTEEAFMANVKKVLDEDRVKEEMSAIGDEAATPEKFVKFMSLEPLYRQNKGREVPEGSTVTTCGDSLTTRTPSRKKAKEATKSKTKTAETVQPPSSDNEWLQLSDKATTPDILSNEKDQKDIQEYNALSQSTWEERIGELDSLTKIIKADLKAHGIQHDESTHTQPSTEAINWLQAATSLHRFIAEGTKVLSPSVFKLRYKEQMHFLEEQKLAALYRSALLSVEKQHRISFLQMVFHKFALMQKPNQKTAESTVKKLQPHPHPLLDRLSHQFPEYFAVYAKSSEK